MNRYLMLSVLVSSIINVGCNSTTNLINADTTNQNQNLQSSEPLNCEALYNAGKYTDALQVCQASINAGNKEAALFLGDMYLLGNIDGNYNVDQAIRYYESTGTVKGYYKAARVYEKGINTNVNLAKALSYYEKAANMGDILSANYVANSYLKGRAVERNSKKAINYFKIAADAGDDKAMYQLGTFYRDGAYVDHDENKAYQYFSSSASKNNVNALYAKAKMEENNQEYIQAEATYKKLLSLKKQPEVLLSAAILMLEKEDGINGKLEGINYLEQAVKQNYLPAIHYQALHLIKGDIYQKDLKRAAENIQRNAENGYAPSMYLLGNIYELGLGVNKSSPNAYAWYHMAYDCGISKGKKKYEELYSSSTLNGNEKSANDKYKQYSKLFKCKNFQDDEMHIFDLTEN